MSRLSALARAITGATKITKFFQPNVAQISTVALSNTPDTPDWFGRWKQEFTENNLKIFLALGHACSVAAKHTKFSPTKLAQFTTDALLKELDSHNIEENSNVSDEFFGYHPDHPVAKLMQNPPKWFEELNYQIREADFIKFDQISPSYTRAAGYNAVVEAALLGEGSGDAPAAIFSGGI